jgi:S1-C subfamily serine protease
MNKRVLKIIGLVVALALALGIGVAAGGGIVYALTRDKEPAQAISSTTIDPGPGIVVAAVVSDGPAAEAGVVRGDILLEVDGEAVDDLFELLRTIEEKEPGDEVQLTVLHGDDERTLPATLGEQEGKPYLGIVPCSGRVGPGPMMFIHAGEPRAMIVEVEPDSPAASAGLEEGDVIIAVDGEELATENTLADVIAAHEPGDTVTLEVTRPGDESDEITVELGEHPEEEGKAYLGLKYRTVPWSHTWEGQSLPFERRRLHVQPFLHGLPGTEAEQGVIVRSVTEDGPADAAGLRRGDLITAIDDDPIKGPQDLVGAIAGHEPGDRVTLTVLEPGKDGEEDEERQVKVTLAEHPEKDREAYLGVQIGGFVHVSKVWPGEHLDRRVPLQFSDSDWEELFDELPFDPEEAPDHFRFHFSPDISIEIDGTDCCGDSI